MLSYCANPYHYQRRQSRPVAGGKVIIGGPNPIVVQSMITCDTDGHQGFGQTKPSTWSRWLPIVRITAPTVKDAANLKKHQKELPRGRL